jgi:hypothetical protein
LEAQGRHKKLEQNFFKSILKARVKIEEPVMVTLISSTSPKFSKIFGFRFA